MRSDVTSAAEMERLILDYGFMPLFQNEIPGFSIEDHTSPSQWFQDGVEGPWDWRGPIAGAGRCVYGKLFRGKAGFVSLEWLQDFINLRRDGYDFDLRYDEGMASRKDKQALETIIQSGSILSRQLKAACGYGKHGQKGFDTVITRLQMQMYVTIAGFEQAIDRFGKPYGWGIARYTTPEAQFGEAMIDAAYERAPEASRARVLAHLTRRLPEADEALIARLIG